MRIAERLTRLEAARASTVPGMTADEIDVAAVVYERKLREGGVPNGDSIEVAVSNWRTLVEQAAPSMQPIWANVEPSDLWA